MIGHTANVDLESIDTPAHTDDTGSHGHPACDTGETSLDRLNPGAGSVGDVGSTVGSNGSRDDCPVDGSLVLLIVDYGTLWYGDGGCQGGTIHQMMIVRLLQRLTQCW